MLLSLCFYVNRLLACNNSFIVHQSGLDDVIVRKTIVVFSSAVLAPIGFLSTFLSGIRFLKVQNPFFPS